MKWKKSLASVLAIVLLLGLVPVTAFAAENTLKSDTAEIPAGQEWEVSEDVTLSSMLWVSGNLTVNKNLTLGSNLLFLEGNVTVKNGGKIVLESWDNITDIGGKLLFELGASAQCSQPIPAEYYDSKSYELSDGSGGTYTVKEKDANKTADSNYVRGKIANLTTAFPAAYRTEKVYTTALTALRTHLTTNEKQITIDGIYNAAVAHVPALDALEAAKTKAVNDLTTYYARQTKYTNELEAVLDAEIKEIDGTKYTKTNYSDSIMNSGDIDTAVNLQGHKDKIDAKVLSNAKEEIKAQIDALGYKNASEAIIAQKSTVEGKSSVKEVEDYLPLAKRALAKAEVNGFAAKAKESNPGLTSDIQIIVDAFNNTADTAPVESLPVYVTNAEKEIQALIDNATALTTAKSGAKSAITGYIETNQGKWTTRLTAIDKGIEDLKAEVNTDTYTGQIDEATTVEAVKAAQKSAEAAIELAIEKAIAKWTLDKEAKGGERLEEIVAQYKGYIEGATSQGNVQQLLDSGLKAIQDKKVEQDAAKKLETAKSDANTVLSSYLETYLNGKSYTAIGETQKGKEKLDEAVVSNLNSKVDPIVTSNTTAIKDAKSEDMVNLYLKTAKSDIEKEANLAIAKHKALKELAEYKSDKKYEQETNSYESGIVAAASEDGVASLLSAAEAAIDSAIEQTKLTDKVQEVLEELKEYVKKQLETFKVDMKNLGGDDQSAAYARINDYHVNNISGLSLSALNVYAKNQHKDLDTYILMDVKTDAKAKLDAYINDQNAQKDYTLIVPAVGEDGKYVQATVEILGKTYHPQIEGVTVADDVGEKLEEIEQEILEKYKGCKLTVLADGASGGYTTFHKIGDKALLSASKLKVTDKTFSHWTINGQRVSYDREINVVIKSNSTYNAVYVPTSSGSGEEDPVKKDDILNVNLFATEEGEKHYINVSGNYEINTDKKVKGVGILYSTKTNDFKNAKEELLKNPRCDEYFEGDEKVSNYYLETTSKKGTWSTKMNVKQAVDAELHVVAYIIYDDNEVVYLNMAKGSWNKLNEEPVTETEFEVPDQ